MRMGKININGVETIISLGIDEEEIEINEREEDTIRLDDVISKTREILDGKDSES